MMPVRSRHPNKNHGLSDGHWLRFRCRHSQVSAEENARQLFQSKFICCEESDGLLNHFLTYYFTQ